MNGLMGNSVEERKQLIAVQRLKPSRVESYVLCDWVSEPNDVVAVDVLAQRLYVDVVRHAQVLLSHARDLEHVVNVLPGEAAPVD